MLTSRTLIGLLFMWGMRGYAGEHCLARTERTGFCGVAILGGQGLLLRRTWLNQNKQPYLYNGHTKAIVRENGVWKKMSIEPYAIPCRNTCD